MREHLLGFLIKALDDHEREELERCLTERPGLQRELELLESGLEPLRDDEGFDPPPAGLARRTCERVAAWKRSQGQPSVEAAPAERFHRSWRRIDAAVGVGLVAASALLFFPAVLQSRAASQVDACRSNLGRIHAGLVRYAQQHGGLFPTIPSSGNEAAAGIYAVRLTEGGYLTDLGALICPAARSDCNQPSPHRVPTAAELASAQGDALRRLHRVMGGSYGYTLGHFAGGQYRHTRHLRRTSFAIMADAPDPCGGCRASGNHGGGQNVLFEDGRVVYLTSCQPGEGCDDFYHNDDGQVQAGLHPDDAVIAPSSARPLEGIAEDEAGGP